MKKMFEVEVLAKKFAEKVNGTVKTSVLPDYMRCDTIYIVEYEEEKKCS